MSTDQEKQLHVIGAATGLGAPDANCEKGPQVLWHATDSEVLQWGEIVAPEGDDLKQFTLHLADVVASAAGQRIAVVGGDHSCAMGTWRGIARKAGRIGLIWLDAHMDAHTRETSPSGCWHGMPVANLLGCKEARLNDKGGVIEPRNLTLIGVRSYEPEEKALLQQLDVKVFTIDDVHRIGLGTVMAEAQQRACDGTDGYGISIDLDGLDPADAPGVGSPVVGGVRADEMLESLSWLRDDAKLLAVEIAEFNPVVDVEQRTKKLLLEMLKTVACHESHN